MKTRPQSTLFMACAFLVLWATGALAAESGARNQGTAPDSITISAPLNTPGTSPGVKIRSTLYGIAITANTVDMTPISQCRNVSLANQTVFDNSTSRNVWPWVPYGKPRAWQRFINNPPARLNVSLCSSTGCTNPAVGVWEECNPGQESNLLPIPVDTKFYTVASAAVPPVPPPAAACGTSSQKCEFNCAPPYKYQSGSTCAYYTCQNPTSSLAHMTKCTDLGDSYDEQYLNGSNRNWSVISETTACDTGWALASKCQYKCDPGAFLIGGLCYIDCPQVNNYPVNGGGTVTVPQTHPQTWTGQIVCPYANGTIQKYCNLGEWGLNAGDTVDHCCPPTQHWQGSSCINYVCTGGVKAHATLCPSDDTNILGGDGTTHVVSTCSPTNTVNADFCEYTCDTLWIKSGDTCVNSCGNGTCDAIANENGTNCPADCCDSNTPCNQTRNNDGMTYCMDSGLNDYMWRDQVWAMNRCSLTNDGCNFGFRCNNTSYYCKNPLAGTVWTKYQPSSCYCGDGYCISGEVCYNGSTGCAGDCGNCACTTQSLDVGSSQSMSYTAGPHGTVRNPGCPSGYTGAPQRTCQYGTWSAEQGTQCSPSACTTQSLDVGSSQTRSYTAGPHGTVRNPGCPAGYTGAPQRTCQYGAWSAEQGTQCSPSACTTQSLDVGSSQTMSYTAGPHGTVRNPGCPSGYTGAPQRTCQYGAWSAEQGTQCSPSACVTQSLDVGSSQTMSYTGGAHGTVRTPGCPAGYTGAPQRTCQYGAWSAEQGTQCSPSSCTTQTLSVGSGQTMSYTAGAHGTVRWPGCPFGYSGSPQRTCQYGSWSAEQGTQCIPACYGSVDPNANSCGVTNPPSPTANRTIGSCTGGYCEFTCKSGYHWDGGNNCLADFCGDGICQGGVESCYNGSTGCTDCGGCSCGGATMDVGSSQTMWYSGTTSGSASYPGCPSYYHGTPYRTCTNGSWSALQGTACVPYACQGSVDNVHSTMCAGSDTGLTADTWRTLSSSNTCTGAKCQWKCDAGWHWVSGETCAADCSCGGWVNQGCRVGGCTGDYQYETRTCTPGACAGESQCTYNPSSCHCGNGVCEPGWSETAANCSDCAVCGNGVVEAGEQCDGANLNGYSCSSFGGGWGGPGLTCSGCWFDYNSCYYCGFYGCEGAKGENCSNCPSECGTCPTPTPTPSPSPTPEPSPSPSPVCTASDTNYGCRAWGWCAGDDRLIYRSYSPSGCGSDGYLCVTDAAQCHCGNGICDYGETCGTCDCGACPTPTPTPSPSPSPEPSPSPTCTYGETNYGCRAWGWCAGDDRLVYRTYTPSGCGTDGYYCVTDAATCHCGNGSCDYGETCGTCDCGACPTPTPTPEASPTAAPTPTPSPSA